MQQQNTQQPLTPDAKIMKFRLYDKKATMTVPVIEIASSFISQMLSYLYATGVDPDKFLKDVGIDINIYDSPDARVPISEFYHIQENAIKITNDNFFGLHIGEFVKPGTWSILGYIIMNCATLYEALERVCRYHEIVGNFIQMRMNSQKDDVTLYFEIRLPDSKNIRHCYEASVSSVVNIIRFLSTKTFSLKRVSFSHLNNFETDEYKRILQCPILFNEKHTTLVFNKKDLQIPIAMNNPRLLELFEQHADNYIKLIYSDNYYTRRVNELILEWLADGTPSLEKVARKLSMSIRSLQSRLSEEGVTYRQLIEDIRKDLALMYLKEKNLSIEDITYLLGFSEPSIFRKKFKKWMGVTPGSYRNPGKNEYDHYPLQVIRKDKPSRKKF